MNLLIKIILPILVLVICAITAKRIVDSKPEPGRRGAPPSTQSVEATRIQPTVYQVLLDSQGTVEPSTATTLVPEVAGSVQSVSDNFVNGGRFSAGEVLVQLNTQDFDIALIQARANLAQAQASLQQESAQARVAKREWESLRQGERASALTLREPQVAAARANVTSAEAQVQRAELDLQRAVLIAPYDGIVLERDVDEGQFVNRGTPIGRIYSSAAVDVRLPLTNRQMAWLDVSSSLAGAEKPQVTLSATVGSETLTWIGAVERVEGVDAGTQQLNVIARVPQSQQAKTAPLRVGQYVSAQISGRAIQNAYVLPRQALRSGNEVILVTEDSALQRQAVTVAWGDEQWVAVTDGLTPNAVLVTTPLSTVANGTPVDAITR